MFLKFIYKQLNVSVQVGDLAYYSVPQNNQSGTNHPNTLLNTKPHVLGGIIKVNHDKKWIIVDTDLGGGCGPCLKNHAPPNTLLYLFGNLYQPGQLNGNEMIFFQKDHQANTSGVIGYFMDTEYRNFSTFPAEIFATAVDYVESSK
jgi:hypothetical protein